jgi:hypothetical protein
MPHWLATERRAQESSVVKRFSPPYWTVDFPRPMMASVVTAGADALRVDAVFQGSGDLAGLIWDSQDRWDHPLLRYETRRNYAGCRLAFRWRSAGVKPLDAVHGPTLTIEGRDASGAPRSWYVRLWNHAAGDPQDARITLDFDGLAGGFLLPDEADPVHPRDIDRMFISIVPAAYDGGAVPFAAGIEAWVELSDMRCSGSGSVLAIGDVMVPEHGLSIATGYDDAYNQTPERLLRQALALGYRGAINHYVGMSHYMRLAADGAAWRASLTGGALNAPCARWHADLAARCAVLGYTLILSLSYELFDAYCPDGWKQRAWDGTPALTGWMPPSTLLSPRARTRWPICAPSAAPLLRSRAMRAWRCASRSASPGGGCCPMGGPASTTTRHGPRWAVRRPRSRRYADRSTAPASHCSTRPAPCWLHRPRHSPPPCASWRPKRSGCCSSISRPCSIRQRPNCGAPTSPSDGRRPPSTGCRSRTMTG